MLYIFNCQIKLNGNTLIMIKRNRIEPRVTRHNQNFSWIIGLLFILVVAIPFIPLQSLGTGLLTEDLQKNSHRETVLRPVKPAIIPSESSAQSLSQAPYSQSQQATRCIDDNYLRNLLSRKPLSELELHLNGAPTSRVPIDGRPRQTGLYTQLYSTRDMDEFNCIRKEIEITTQLINQKREEQRTSEDSGTFRCERKPCASIQEYNPLDNCGCFVQ